MDTLRLEVDVDAVAMRYGVPTRDVHMRSLEGVGSTVLAGSNGDGPVRKTSSSMSFLENNDASRATRHFVGYGARRIVSGR